MTGWNSKNERPRVVERSLRLHEAGARTTLAKPPGFLALRISKKLKLQAVKN